jgi:DNA-binding transcriptional LysR family regulator
MTLTWEGSTYAERCRDLLGDLDRLDIEIAQSASAPSGELRIEMPPGIAQAFILPRILEFSALYPNVDITIFLDSVASSLTERGIDVAIQLGDLESSSLIARKIYVTRKVACASPDYIAESGIPQHPNDLLDKKCLAFSSPKKSKPRKWNFQKDDESIEIIPPAHLLVNSSGALIELAKKGGGIVYVLDILVAKYIKTGELVRILPDWETQKREVYILFHDKRNAPEKVRLFIDFVIKIFDEI